MTYEFHQDGSMDASIADQPLVKWPKDWWVENGELVLHKRPTNFVDVVRERFDVLDSAIRKRPVRPGHFRFEIQFVDATRIRLFPQRGRPLELTPFPN